LIKVDSSDDPLDSLVDGSILKQDIGGLSPQLEGKPRMTWGLGVLLAIRRSGLSTAGGKRLRNQFAHFGGSRESDLVDAPMIDQRRARRARARNDIHHPRWKFGFLKYLRQLQRRDAGGLGGFEDDSISASQRRSDLPGGHQEGKIPGYNLSGDT